MSACVKKANESYFKTKNFFKAFTTLFIFIYLVWKEQSKKETNHTLQWNCKKETNDAAAAYFLPSKRKSGSHPLNKMFKLQTRIQYLFISPQQKQNIKCNAKLLPLSHTHKQTLSNTTTNVFNQVNIYILKKWTKNDLFMSTAWNMKSYEMKFAAKIRSLFFHDISCSCLVYTNCKRKKKLC